MKKFNHVLRLALCMSVLAVTLSVPATRAAGPPGGLDVNVVNTPSNPVPVTLQGTSTVSGNVAITNTPNVNVVNAPTVNIGNSLKPSQLVTLETTNGCPTGLPGTAFDQLEGADATRHGFSIPAGKVLVVTAAELNGRPGSAGHVGNLALFRVSADGHVSNVTRVDGAIDNAGILSRALNFPGGAVVKSGVTLCVSASDVSTGTLLTTTGWVHGYLADDE